MLCVCMLFILFVIYFYRDLIFSIFFFFNDTATTEIYTLSLHDALPICVEIYRQWRDLWHRALVEPGRGRNRDRKSTRLNSSHANISYAVFCLKKKKKKNKEKKKKKNQNRKNTNRSHNIKKDDSNYHNVT